VRAFPEKYLDLRHHLIHHYTFHRMGKRKTQKDPEALPDAPEASNKRKNDDSDSDEV
jgi:hypothetical protein